MNAVERIEAAIERLESLRAESTRDRWLPSWEDVRTALEPGESAVVFGGHRRADADLIVTLHRTIDAQLAILREAKARPGWADRQLAYDPLAVTLADAILGVRDGEG